MTTVLAPWQRILLGLAALPTIAPGLASTLGGIALALPVLVPQMLSLWRRRQGDPIGKHFVAALAHRGQDREHQHERRDRQKPGADRLVDEGRKVAARHQQRPAQIFFHQLAEHEPEQHRRRLEIELDQRIADQREGGREHTRRRANCSPNRCRCTRTSGSPGTSGDTAP